MQRLAPGNLKIHSAYRDAALFVWGETQPREGAEGLPQFGVSRARISDAIEEICQAGIQAEFQTATVWMPKTASGPATIRPVRVPAAILPAEYAFYFLDACNRSPWAENEKTKLAPDTRFWGAAFRFVAYLALWERFLPSMRQEGTGFQALWRPLISASDREYLRRLAQAMPPIARAVTSPGTKRPPEDDPAVLVSGFVSWLMDVFPRIANRSARLPNVAAGPRRGVEPAWTRALRLMNSTMEGDTGQLTRFLEQVRAWEAPVVREAEFPWLLSFDLREPEEGGEWRVGYSLVAADGGPPLPTEQALD